MTVVDWDELEKAGHDLTHCGMIMAGTFLYYCENCGCLLMVRGSEILFFHAHRGTISDLNRCHDDVPRDPKSLKEKLDEIRDADFERLRRMDDD